MCVFHLRTTVSSADKGYMSPLGGMGTGLGLGLLIMPLSLGAMMLRRPSGPVRKLISAGALNPEMARRSATVGIPREDVLRPWIRFGVVHRLPDGRWFVDARRERWVRFALWCGIGLLAGTLLAIMLWSGALLPETEAP